MYVSDEGSRKGCGSEKKKNSVVEETELHESVALFIPSLEFDYDASGLGRK